MTIGEHGNAPCTNLGADLPSITRLDCRRHLIYDGHVEHSDVDEYCELL